MREIRQSGSEGGGNEQTVSPYPYGSREKKKVKEKEKESVKKIQPTHRSGMGLKAFLKGEGDKGLAR